MLIEILNLVLGTCGGADVKLNVITQLKESRRAVIDMNPKWDDKPLLSVVIPCYNIEDYLGNTLDSIVDSYFPKDKLEVILVDDESDDSTGEIMDKYASEYPYMVAYHKKNGGVSEARNYGFDRAHGKYINYLDSDDMTAVTGWSKLVNTAEVNHADIAVGFVWRYDSRRNKPSYLHRQAIDHDVAVTTFKDNVLSPDDTASLLYDTTVWNKVFRRDFLVENNIRFIKDTLYEDIPYTLEAHLKASRISIIKDVVYRWQWRESFDSITQSRDDIENYQTRLNIMNLSRELIEDDPNLTDSEKEQLIFKLKLKIMKVDVQIFIENIANATESYRLQVLELTHEFLDRWGLLSDEAYRDLYPLLPMKNQLQLYAIKTGDLYLFKQYSYQKEFGKIKRSNGKYIYNNDEVSTDVNNFLQLKDVLPVTQKITNVNYDEDTDNFSIDGMLRIKLVPMYRSLLASGNWHEKLTFQFKNINTGETINIDDVKRVKRSLFTRLHSPKSSYNFGGYALSVPEFSKVLPVLANGTWKIEYLLQYVDNQDEVQYQAQGYLASPKKASKNKPEAVLEAKTFAVDYSTNWHLLLNVADVLTADNLKDYSDKYVLTDVTIEQPDVTVDENDDSITFKVSGKSSNLWATLLKSGQPLLEGLKVKASNTDKSKGYQTWEFTFKLSDLLASDYMDKSMHLVLVDADSNMRLNYVIEPTVLKNTTLGARNYQVVANNDSEVKNYWFKYQLMPVYLKPLKWTHKKSHVYLTFELKANWKTTSFSIDDFNVRELELLSTDKQNEYLGSEDSKSLRIEKGTDNTAMYTLDLSKLSDSQMASGRYDWFLKAYGEHDKEYRFPIMTDLDIDDPDRADLKYSVKGKVPLKYVFYTTPKGYYRLKVTKSFTGIDRKKRWRGLSYSVLYPLMRMLPLKKDTVVFDSFWASKNNDSPRAISDYINANFPKKYKLIWMSVDPGMTPPAGATIVRKNTLAYWYYYATAKYLVENTNFPQAYAKRQGQIEVQTLHGTFMKTMGFDEPHFRNASNRVQNNFAKRNSRWDLTVSPSDYMTDKIEHAFNYDHKVLTSGFPRNDGLYKNNTLEFKEKTRNKLGLKSTDKVILYAPTYREQGTYDLELNLEELKAKLPDDYRVLVRLHYFVAHQAEIPSLNGFVINVSDYPDINDLYLISDIMVTDYSSVMFDYAHLVKPMVFFAYDKDWYLDPDNRGTYLDYEQEVPGPIVETTEDLANVLNDLPKLSETYYDKLLKFHNKYAQYGQQGDATEQVVTAMFDSNLDLSYQQATGTLTMLFNKLLHLFKVNNFQSRLLNYLGSVLPKKNIMIFESFFGQSYSDNPKAIYEYVKEHYPKYRLYWNVNEDSIDYFKENNIPYVKRFGYKGILKQAQAKYFITNTRRPFRWKKPKGTTLLQTWHGTPLKTIGTDVSMMNMPGNNVSNYHRQVVKDSRRWDYLLTPNNYSTEIMQRAFRKDANQIMYTGGYPRNDVLTNASVTHVRELKAKLGLDPTKKTLLYAPTWRDDEYIKADVFTAKLHLDLDKLHLRYPDVQILIRTHYMIANNLDLTGYSDFAINVSDYPDIAELYLVSDLLITDYSSVFFDYAILKRPMIFFAYDLKTYATATRGFYIPYKELVPGPIVETNDELLDVLGDYLDDWEPDDRFNEFNAKFNPNPDGNASKRAVEMLLSGSATRAVSTIDLVNDDLASHAHRVQDGALCLPSDYDFTSEQQLTSVKSKIKYLPNSAKGYHHVNVLSTKHLVPNVADSDLKIGTTYYQVIDELPYWVAEQDLIDLNDRKTIDNSHKVL